MGVDLGRASSCILGTASWGLDFCGVTIKAEHKTSIGIATVVAGVVAVLPLGSVLLAAGGKLNDIEAVVAEQAAIQDDIKEFRTEQSAIKDDLSSIKIEQATQGEKLKNIDFNLRILIQKLDRTE